MSPRIELVYFTGCPHVEAARSTLRAALILRQWSPAWTERDSTAPGTPEEYQVYGSPTILVDGEDPFAAGDETFGLACRVYQTPDGPAGSPTTEQLEAILDA